MEWQPTWEEKVEAGLEALYRWADRNGVDYIPADERLIRGILVSLENLARSKQQAYLDAYVNLITLPDLDGVKSVG